MLQASLAAIPIYLGLFMLAIPFDSDAGVERGLVLFAPIIVFVGASILYSIGFLTPLFNPELEGFNSSDRLRQRVVRRKMTLISLGSILLSVGVLSGALILIKAHL
jgi:hypothetical protein